MVTILSLFINKLTTPRTLSNDELLINGLFLFDTPLSKKYTEEEIRQMVNVSGNIHI